MKTPRWTKADAKRAEKMGWGLREQSFETGEADTHWIERLGDRFKSDDEAIEEVIAIVEHEMHCLENRLIQITCRKALHLCAKG